MQFRYNTPDTIQHFLKFANDVYINHSSHFSSISTEQFFGELNPEGKEIFLQVFFFYYHRAWKYLNKIEFLAFEIDEGFVLLAVVSLIEASMNKARHKTAFQWLKENLQKYKPWNAKSLDIAQDDYINKFGINIAFKNFLKNYLTDVEKEKLSDLMQVWNEKDKSFIPMNIEELGKMIYGMRSKFVHQAKYVPISSRVDMSLAYIDDKFYSFGHFKDIIDILERGVFRRFQDSTYKN